jgi:hypothetical protein
LKSRFTYIGSSVIEVVVNGDSLTWNVLAPDLAAAAPAALLEAAPPPESLPVPAAAPEPEPSSVPTLGTAESSMTLAAAPTAKQRTSKGVIRTMWTAIFSAGGVGLVYALDNLTALNLSPAIGLAVGAVGYGAKAAIFPNSKL